ncbi:MAG TPA: hypothetical protein VEB59_11370 [Gemmatimonadales bacterium]|nr:hypothetical protein [Gemmatimonadales bacterium]
MRQQAKHSRFWAVAAIATTLAFGSGVGTASAYDPLCWRACQQMCLAQYPSPQQFEQRHACTEACANLSCGGGPIEP